VLVRIPFEIEAKSTFCQRSQKPNSIDERSGGGDWGGRGEEEDSLVVVVGTCVVIASGFVVVGNVVEVGSGVVEERCCVGEGISCDVRDRRFVVEDREEENEKGRVVGGFEI